jgi:O-antigen ligase
MIDAAQIAGRADRRRPSLQWLRTAGAFLDHLDALHVLRCATFIGALLVIWASLQPFAPIGDVASGDAGSGKMAATYLTFGLLAVVGLGAAWPGNGAALRSFVSPAFLALGGWMAFNILLSQDRNISLQRFMLAGCGILVAAMVPLLASSRAEFRRWIGLCALVLLLLCYAGIELVPDLTVHLKTDPIEPQLAGDWRGTFGHKNLAAPVMAMIVFVGLYLARSGSPIAGSAILLLSAVFLLNSHGKSATALCLLTILVSEAVARMRSGFWRAVTCFTPLVAMNMFSVGTVLSDTLAKIVQVLPFDTSFTGRTDIWRFGFESIARKPITGYGFAAFWGQDTMQLPAEDEIAWATEAAHSHNGFVDTALTLGIPGLLLVTFIFVLAPFRNFAAAQALGNDDGLARLYFRLWLFGAYLASMESFFMDRVNPIWITFLIGVFGLHYLARFRLRD